MSALDVQRFNETCFLAAADRVKAAGYEVLAFDFAAETIERARRYAAPAGATITYNVG
ncbi:MAG TPA: hypothetical protein VL334_07775 [Anaerolineae bacterium]|nr:hypothetical protein [Anaerolineae bacterium]